MLLDFNDMKEITAPGMNAIHIGGSIGLHKHETSDDINYVLSGIGKAICDGKEEILRKGTCHICKKVLNIVSSIQAMKIYSLSQ